MGYIATYNWLHVKTGQQGTAVYQGESEHELLVFLNHSNSQNPGQWHYWY
jgi:hypothetical protein